MKITSGKKAKRLKQPLFSLQTFLDCSLFQGRCFSKQRHCKKLFVFGYDIKSLKGLSGNDVRKSVVENFIAV